MAEYNIEFSENLIDAGNLILIGDPHSFDAHQTVLYLSLLSCEITLKALLEKSGMQINIIRKRSHNLHELLVDLGKCKVPLEIGNTKRWVSASKIRGRVVDKRYANATIGTMLEAESKGASKYPNGIRYGDKFFYYPPSLMLKTAIKTMQWAREHWDTIRI
ncbi:MAG: hypothetical protein Q7U10_11510 [Thermodesulfovibrionia bacterium]|nr:hypothetical protein [Thermodesulfovibrionia bacterium]